MIGVADGDPQSSPPLPVIHSTRSEHACKLTSSKAAPTASNPLSGMRASRDSTEVLLLPYSASPSSGRFAFQSIYQKAKYRPSAAIGGDEPLVVVNRLRSLQRLSYLRTVLAVLQFSLKRGNQRGFIVQLN